MNFPFLYFGHAPQDWYEGANFGHVVEGQLLAPPNEMQREYIATLFEQRFDKSPAAILPEQPWFWSGPYFCFSFGERWSGAGRAAFSALTDFLLDVHRATPLAEVNLWSAREPGDSRWHVWTMSQRRLPSPRPRYQYEPVNLIYPAKRDPALGTYAQDANFEQARRAARKSLAVSKATTLDGPLQLVPVDSAPLHVPTPDELAHFEAPDPALRLRKPPTLHGDYAQKAAGRVWAWRYENDKRVSFMYLDDAGHKKKLGVEGQLTPHEFTMELHGPFLHGSGCQAYFRLPNAVFDLDFTTGVFARRFRATPGETIHCLQWIEGDTWALLSSKSLTLLDLSAERPQLLSSLPVQRMRLHGARGQLLVASHWSEKPILFGVAAGQLKKLAAVEIKADFVDSDGDNIFITKDSVQFRLEGWEPFVQEFIIAVRAKAEKARKKKPVAWSAIACENSPFPAQPAESRRLALVSVARSGARIVLYPSKPDEAPYLLRYDRLEFVAAEGARHDLSLAGQSFRGVALSPDERVVMALVPEPNGEALSFALRVLPDGAWQFPEGTFDLKKRGLWACAALDESTLAILTENALSIWSFGSGTATCLDEMDVRSAVGLAVIPSRGLVAVLGAKKDNVIVAQWSQGKLTTLARLPGRLVELRVHDETIFGCDPEGLWYRVQDRAERV